MGFWADLPWSKEVQRLKEMHAEEQRKNKFLKDLNRELIADLEITKDDLRRSEKSESILRSMKIQLEDELSEKTFRLTQAERELTVGTRASPDDREVVG
ncbi:hypothetical protein BFW01_g12418 [Lasiodiplodia theobromae]|uniref:Uncharacterized protein n=1 Tax=Lasiodiplodia theobromae TaxID=45133 RepID=A0A5N5DMS6_9PEZI|nr:C6 transcription factor [Lasiodiplodia theobromae]KAB2578621.1 hypothetical protein DBV05_g2855 [Lasiodiplodia theobromae]KAF4538536.1 C6 transcription factor [Lasiodiplodia theobromae]KAF9640612.1 hypothetical protein BFW01_g12418 [Lasiodiplodia theobromae]